VIEVRNGETFLDLIVKQIEVCAGCVSAILSHSAATLLCQHPAFVKLPGGDALERKHFPAMLSKVPDWSLLFCACLFELCPAQTLNAKYGSKVPLVLMNSFNTDEDTAVVSTSGPVIFFSAVKAKMACDLAGGTPCESHRNALQTLRSLLLWGGGGLQL